MLHIYTYTAHYICILLESNSDNAFGKLSNMSVCSFKWQKIYNSVSNLLEVWNFDFLQNFETVLTSFILLISFYTPWKHRKTRGNLCMNATDKFYFLSRCWYYSTTETTISTTTGTSTNTDFRTATWRTSAIPRWDQFRI